MNSCEKLNTISNKKIENFEKKILRKKAARQRLLG